jgi:type IV pilus assembly protein PilA
VNKKSGLKMNSAAGFSLVELMVVVAIIGILASVAVPQFQKFTFKARLTEGKAGLTSLYTAEKAFYAEWSDFDSRFGIIGYRPEGRYYFNIGFAASVASANWAQANPVVPAGTDITFTTVGSCAVVGCQNVPGMPAAAPAFAGTQVANCAVNNAAPKSFNACASANAVLNPDNLATNMAVSSLKIFSQNVP